VTAFVQRERRGKRLYEYFI